jgi:transcription initiation factor TFIIIB Brf1 subunit/transcription initiation factor TFIIB
MPECGESELVVNEEGKTVCPRCGEVRVLHYPESDVIIHNDPDEEKN